MWGEDTAHISVAASVAQSTFTTQHVKRSDLAAREQVQAGAKTAVSKLTSTAGASAAGGAAA